MEIKHLRPAPDRIVPDPERGYQPLAAEGRRVEVTTYWQRRIDDNDVIDGPAEQSAAVQPVQS